jgi:hypothetical protein
MRCAYFFGKNFTFKLTSYLGFYVAVDWNEWSIVKH